MFQAIFERRRVVTAVNCLLIHELGWHPVPHRAHFDSPTYVPMDFAQHSLAIVDSSNSLHLVGEANENARWWAILLSKQP